MGSFTGALAGGLLIGIVQSVMSTLWPEGARLMIYVAPKIGLVDTPSERRIHKKVIPRAGGIAVYLTAMIGMSLLYATGHPFSRSIDSSWMAYFAMASGIIFIIGIIDDKRGLSAWIKLGGQILAAVVLFMHPGSS